MTEIIHTMLLSDNCPPHPQCNRCGQLFNVGDMVHDVPHEDGYKLLCARCYKSVYSNE